MSDQRAVWPTEPIHATDSWPPKPLRIYEQFDYAPAIAARDTAVLQVQANSVVWRTIAWDVLRELAAKRELLTSDDLTEEMDRRGHIHPSDARAVGPVMQRAIREHVLVPVGFVRGRNPKHHLDWARQYRSVR